MVSSDMRRLSNGSGGQVLR